MSQLIDALDKAAQIYDYANNNEESSEKATELKLAALSDLERAFEESSHVEATIQS